MEEIVANTNNITFDVEFMLDQQVGARRLPFDGMDKSNAGICAFFQRNLCSKLGRCPFRHVRRTQSVVCKHWLRGLCKKGDDCEFLHQFDMSKMPECNRETCGNKECPFLHLDPNKKQKACAWYDRGFCRHGASCKNRHVRRVMCPCYLSGFCPEGLHCRYFHPKWDLPTADQARQRGGIGVPICLFCGAQGHKILACRQAPDEEKNKYKAKMYVSRAKHGEAVQITPEVIALSNEEIISKDQMMGRQKPPTHATPEHFFRRDHEAQMMQQQNDAPGVVHPLGQIYAQASAEATPDGHLAHQVRRDQGVITCYKCHETGHYANHCPLSTAQVRAAAAEGRGNVSGAGPRPPRRLGAAGIPRSFANPNPNQPGPRFPFSPEHSTAE